MRKKISIVGTVGVPASYGGFETLVDNLAKFHEGSNCDSELEIYCSSKSYPVKRGRYCNAKLKYVNVSANGGASVVYDVISLFHAAMSGADIILLLGVSGALVLPVLRVFSKARIVTNIDGVEWKREKWSGFARFFLKLSERMAVKYSHAVIADNDGISRYVSDTYMCNCHVIAYGGDHAVGALSAPYSERKLPKNYALALCRIEPENNVEMILKAFSAISDVHLVFVGNWGNSQFGLELRERYKSFSHLHLLDPIYDLGVLRSIREGAIIYVHGHSAGGTNPSLVEMMHFGLPVLAFDCVFNRCTTENKALFFSSDQDLYFAVVRLTSEVSRGIGVEMLEIANRRYTWNFVGKQYFGLFDSVADC